MENNNNFKSGFVSILGRTNVGKSSIINNLVGEKVSAIANKLQTTRTAIKAIVNRPNSQIIFLDTPGIHKPKSKLGDTMVETAFGSLKDVDLIVFVVEATSNGIGKGDKKASLLFIFLHIQRWLRSGKHKIWINDSRGCRSIYAWY